MLVCVDPGHGGTAPGAVWDGIREADIALTIALRLERALSLAGHHVVMTRREDETVALDDRARLANAQRCDRFVSIHCNSVHVSQSHRAEGIETLFYAGSPRGEALARAIQDELVLAFPGHLDRGLKPRGDLTVLIATRMPAALVEVEFLSQPRMRVLMQECEWQTRCAQAIARGAVAPLEAPSATVPSASEVAPPPAALPDPTSASGTADRAGAAAEPPTNARSARIGAPTR